MDFRWVILITLWTLLAGPAFGPPSSGSPPIPEIQARADTVAALPAAVPR
jgi:hypothetical protein